MKNFFDRSHSRKLTDTVGRTARVSFTGRFTHNALLLHVSLLLLLPRGPGFAQTGATLAGTVAPSGGHPAFTQSRHFRLDTLAAGVYAAIHNDSGGYAICNAGIIDLGDRTLVFDCFMTPEAARDLKRAAEEVTGHPVSFVVNSHCDNDHIRGNQVFVPGAEIISTSWTRQAIAASEPEQIRYEQENAPNRLAGLEQQWKTASPEERSELLMWIGYYRGMIASHPELRLTLPTLTFDDTLSLYGTARTVMLRAMGKGHTESDLVLYLPREKLLFAGDLLFVGRHPWLGDGFPWEWKETLRSMSGWDIKRVVPGHGPVSPREALLSLAEYIDTLSAIAAKGRAAGWTEEEVAALPIPAKYKGWFFGRFYPSNLRALYQLTPPPAR